jgi:hypothetical protein
MCLFFFSQVQQEYIKATNNWNEIDIEEKVQHFYGIYSLNIMMGIFFFVFLYINHCLKYIILSNIIFF